MGEQGWDLNLLYDGECPLCMREVRMLERRNQAGRLKLTDIAAADFDASRYGLTQEQVMGRIHGILPDGKAVTGMEVFRRAYRAVGLGALMAPTGWPGLRSVFDRAYAIFARNRLRLTGRSANCDQGRCALPQS